MASAGKTDRGSRRGPTRDEIIKGIVGSYHVTDGCPPLATHWGGYDLANTHWFKRFSEGIADSNGSLEAWDSLKGKCDTSSLIELLYLLTARGKHLVEESQDSDRALAVQIEKTISKYDKLMKFINRFIQNPQLSHTMPYARFDLAKEVHILQDSKQRLEVYRDFYKKFGSGKRKQRDWYLFLIARNVRDATGHLHVTALASLIDSADAAHNPRAAHNQRGDVTDASDLSKRIKRFTEFLAQLNAIRNKNKIPSTSADTNDPILRW